MTLFQQVCQRRPVVHVKHETHTNNALQGTLKDVIGLFSVAMFLITVGAYVPELWRLLNV